MNDTIDKIYGKPREQIGEFCFDEQVAHVFADMIQRSVPGYNTILQTIGQFTQHFAKPHTQIYDLGCSLGAATLAMQRHLHQPGCKLIAVDNSKAMIKQAKLQLSNYRLRHPVELVCANILQTTINNASIVVLNFTLQFIDPCERAGLIQRVYQGLNPGGILILSEKIKSTSEPINDLLATLYWDFKRNNGYSELEICQKRAALENVLRPDTLATQGQRLRQAGFQQYDLWYQCYNFASLIAVK